jgi:hypothetical protein
VSENTHVLRALPARDIEALADRLFSRAAGALADPKLSLRGDLFTASSCLRRLASDNPDGVEVWVWRPSATAQEAP